MGAVERLLSSQVLGFQAQLSQADSTRAREHEQSTDWLKKAADEHTAEIIHKVRTDFTKDRAEPGFEEPMRKIGLGSRKTP